eukprot:SAG31_NODE_63_length_28659_cov_23.074685_15_plen_56_part_00
MPAVNFRVILICVGLTKFSIRVLEYGCMDVSTSVLVCMDVSTSVCMDASSICILL